jgi:hypothetical protein
LAPAVSSTTVSSTTTTALFVLLRLAARLAALGSGVAAFLEKLLIFSCKREFLPAVATG